jgi:GTP cyclohydrolase II
VPLEVSPVAETARKYLQTKKEKLGHRLKSV